nr:MAG TPA: hypothetical protein [Caudoviricetes sp.]
MTHIRQWHKLQVLQSKVLMKLHSCITSRVLLMQK